MPIVMTLNRNPLHTSRYQSPTKSLDCAEEFSFDHWARLCELLSESEGAIATADTTPSAGSGLKKAVSKVEPAAADQHLAGNVV